DPGPARAGLRRLGYGYLSVRLRFPAASLAKIRTLRTRTLRKEKMPARTVLVRSLPLSVRRLIAASLTRKRSRGHESTRSCGGTRSIRNRTVCTTVPPSLVALRPAAHLLPSAPAPDRLTLCEPGCRSAG